MSKAYNTIIHDTRKFSKKMVIPNVRISPELAAEFLQHNTGNRPISNMTIKEYAADMRAGKWKENGDSIRFSVTGKLLDGQHRLKAQIEADYTLVTDIKSGLADESFDAMDIGRNRSASDVVAIIGFENHTTMAGAVKLIMSYEGNKMYTADSTSKKFSNAEVVKYIQTLRPIDQELLKECVTFGNKSRGRAKFFSGTTYAAFCYMFSKKNKEQAFFFFELLTTGENIGKQNYSMIYLLRQKLINLQMSTTYLGTIDRYALLIKSWNHFRNEKEIEKLTWQSDREEFPTIK